MLAIVSLLAVLGAVPAAAVASSAPSNFLLVSGVTAADENCLVGAETGVWLDSCQTAVADLSGREIWSLASDGSLVQAGSKQCLGARKTGAGAALELLSCDTPGGVSKWELQANGQIKMAGSNMCMSQLGVAPGLTNAAAGASASASSTLDASHGAAMAVDGVASTYWVSKLDEEQAVTLTLELGEPVHGSFLDVSFEFVPSSFAVYAAGASSEWQEIFATDSRVLTRLKIPSQSLRRCRQFNW